MYLVATGEWIEEVVRLMNERQLKPENSRFMIAFFSSMDNDFVNYFRDNKERISSYSGQNFHIFTPLIYESYTVPDDQWRYMRNEFRDSGVPLTNDPTFVFFSLEAYSNASSRQYHPFFFAGFACASFDDFPNKLKNAIDVCLDTEVTPLLVDRLSVIFESQNILWHHHGGELENAITRKIPKSTLFISHSNLDKPFVRKLVEELSKDNSIKLWIDEKEISAGDDIQRTITSTLRRESDFLLLVISEHSTTSSWVQFEVSQFISSKEGKNIIPLIVSKEHRFPKPIDDLITRLKYLDFTDETKWQANIQDLKQAINEKSGQR